MTGVQHKVVGVGFGVAGAIVAVQGMGEPFGAFLLPAAVVGCMLPDIDHDMTKIGSKRKIVTRLTSKMLNTLIIGGIFVGGLLILAIAMGFNKYGLDVKKLVIALAGLIFVFIAKKFVVNSKTFKWSIKHRGIMHTLVVPGIMWLLMSMSDFPPWRWGMLGLIVGYCSHLFADMLTIAGCPVLFPLTKRNIRFLKLKTNEKSCTVAAWIVALAVVGITFFIYM